MLRIKRSWRKKGPTCDIARENVDSSTHQVVLSNPVGLQPQSTGNKPTRDCVLQAEWMSAALMPKDRCDSHRDVEISGKVYKLDITLTISWI
ncbi:hypothetical protein RRG08_059945 [Elysia crispata]|uniref:Uncharacterized protein n=1 Tax=Elysia crispata TaxID=231223 RepID=A0AAE0Y8B4_9GAST|nr:hypothetical protein RRG08_059945 [Elysia crispata]